MGGKTQNPKQVNAHYEKELADKGIDTYEELAKHYKALKRETATEEERQEVFGDLRPNSAYIHVYDKANLKSKEYLDTTEELKEAVKGQMMLRDEQNAHYQQLEAQYQNEFKGIKTYDQLAEWYKGLYGTLNDRVFPNKGDFERTNLKSFEHLDTYAELKRAMVYALEERDHTAELYDRYGSDIEGFDTHEKLLEHYQDLYNEVHGRWPDPSLLWGHEGRLGLQHETMLLMEERDSKRPVPENHPAAPGGPAFPEVEPDPPPFTLPRNFQDQLGIKNSETETPPDSDEQVAAAERGETQTPLDFLLKEQLRQGGLLDEEDEQEKGEAPPVDKPETVASSVEPSQPLPPEVAEEAITYDPNMGPDRPPEDDSGLRIDPETGWIDPDSVGHPLLGSFEDFPGIAEDALYRNENYEEDIFQKETQNQTIDTQDVQGDALVQKEAQEEHQGINTQEQQSKFEATPEQSVSSTEAQWSVDQD